MSAWHLPLKFPPFRRLSMETQLSLTVGGVKAYNLENLNSTSGSDQHFKVFIGFQNKVCTNMCVSTDGYLGDLKIKNLKQLKASMDYLFPKLCCCRTSQSAQEIYSTKSDGATICSPGRQMQNVSTSSQSNQGADLSC
jgi:hypothetical protein